MVRANFLVDVLGASGCLLCVVITAVWASPLCAQRGFSLESAGIHAGAIIDREGVDGSLLGAHGRFTLSSNLLFAMNLSWRPGFPDDPTGRWTGYAIQAHTTLRLQPFGSSSVLDFGYGVAAGLSAARDPVRALRVSNMHVADAAVISVGPTIGNLRPFVDLYVVDLLRTVRAPGTHLLIGLSILHR